MFAQFTQFIHYWIQCLHYSVFSNDNVFSGLVKTAYKCYFCTLCTLRPLSVFHCGYRPYIKSRS